MAQFTVRRKTYLTVTGVLAALIVLAAIFIGIGVVQVSNLTAEIDDLKSRHNHDKTLAESLLDHAERRNYDLEQSLANSSF